MSSAMEKNMVTFLEIEISVRFSSKARPGYN
jgi:hypothetical protein